MFTMRRIHSFHDNSKMFFATSIEDIIDVTFLPEHALSAGLSGKRASCMTGFNRKAAKQNLPELSSSPILESTQEHNQQNQRFLHSVDSVRSTTWRKTVIIVFFEHKNYSCEPSIQAVQPLLHSLDALTRQLVQRSRFRKEKKSSQHWNACNPTEIKNHDKNKKTHPAFLKTNQNVWQMQILHLHIFNSAV